MPPKAQVDIITENRIEGKVENPEKLPNFMPPSSVQIITVGGCCYL